MITTYLIALLIFTGPAFGIPVQDTERSAPDLADTVRINQSIELSQQNYEEFENERSLFYAERALDLSKRLLDSLETESGSNIFNQIKALTIDSYVTYARILREYDIQAAEESLKTGLLLLQETDTREIAAIYSELGSTYDRMGQDDRALEFHSIALDLYKSSGNQSSYMGQLLNMGLVLRSRGNYGDSLEYLMESLKIARQLNDSPAIVESLLAMGFVYAFVEKWEDALKSQQEALEIFQEANNELGIARIHNDMGVTYSRAGQPDSSLVHHRAALALRLESNDSYNTFSSYLYIGDILASQGNITEAVEYYEEGLTYSNEIGFKISVVNARLRLGDYYLMLSEANNAKENYETALQLSREIDASTGKSRAHLGLAGIAIFKGEYEVAIEMLRLAEETIPETNLQVKEEVYRGIAETYFNLGDFRNAYLNSIIYSEVKDSVLSAANLSKITQLTNILSFENEMALNQESNEKLMALQQIEINRERLKRNIILAGLIIALMLIGIIFVRFIEKKKLSDKLNDTLKNLNATQSQLIQQEKLASLGQLTAGIAHEIKNPLNFVNNFSEVSIEMVDEIRAELAAVQTQCIAPPQDSSSPPGISSLPGDNKNIDAISEILDDIETNLRKIHGHGTRADSIVKSMLLHSRGGSGKMEPAPLNSVIKEYVNLAFHGMRASKNPFNVDIQMDLDDSIGEIPMITEDFSRVILNVCNNAFDAMREKSIQNSKFKIQNYSPKLTIRTQKTDSGISIEIEDNGPGIPDEIKDNILQPFFTTKKGTQGTGLGLSITNDIIKAHGGILDVKSKRNEFTIFSITLAQREDKL